jgi:hypothetical protein
MPAGKTARFRGNRSFRKGNFETATELGKTTAFCCAALAK